LAGRVDTNSKLPGVKRRHAFSRIQRYDFASLVLGWGGEWRLRRIRPPLSSTRIRVVGSEDPLSKKKEQKVKDLSLTMTKREWNERLKLGRFCSPMESVTVYAVRGVTKNSRGLVIVYLRQKECWASLTRTTERKTRSQPRRGGG